MRDASSWSLTKANRSSLGKIASELKGLAALASRGTDLIAIAEALQAIEDILEGNPVETNVGLTVGFRRGDKDYREGLYIGFRINQDELTLDELNTTYSSDFGSDHSTRTYANLNPGGSFDDHAVFEWLERLNEIMNYDDAFLSSEKDHL
jgi:hypothetical protein